MSELLPLHLRDAGGLAHRERVRTERASGALVTVDAIELARGRKFEVQVEQEVTEAGERVIKRDLVWVDELDRAHAVCRAAVDLLRRDRFVSVSDAAAQAGIRLT